MTDKLPELLTFTNIELAGAMFVSIAQHLPLCELEVFKVTPLESVTNRERAIAERLKEIDTILWHDSCHELKELIKELTEEKKE
jgi:hypothetical protein